MKERFFAVTFPEDLVREPIIYSLVSRHGLEPIVYKASVTNSGGWLVVQLTGDAAMIDEAVTELKCRGALIREGGKELLELSAPEAIRSVRMKLELPREKVNEPIYSKMINKFDVAINIRQADIGPDKGEVDLEMSGTLEAIDNAVDSLKQEGIGVLPIEGNVIE